MMKISEIMTDCVVTVGMDDPLSMVKEIFDNLWFHHLLVIDKGLLVGVVSDRDLLRALSPYLGTLAEINRDKYTIMQPVHKIMSRNPITLRADADISDAVEIFSSQKISCIPIVDESAIPLGIVSWRDILKSL